MPLYQPWMARFYIDWCNKRKLQPARIASYRTPLALDQAPTLSLEKEKERIEGKRTRNVARTARYLDARLRTIGLDTDALDKQIREQRAREERERVSGSTQPAPVF